MAANVGAAASADVYLPSELLFLIFEKIAQEDPTFVREAFPLLVRACRDTFRSAHGSPLYETVHVHFAGRSRGNLHAASAAAWLAARAEHVRKLVIDIEMGSPDNESCYDEDGPAILRFVGPHLDELSVKVEREYPRPVGRPIWRSLSSVVAPAANLRSLRIDTTYASDFDPSQRDAQALARLTRLEKLVLKC